MEQRCDKGNSNCRYYIPDYEVGFKMVSPRQGERYEGHKFNNNSLVFVLDGEVEFSYNDFLNRRFIKGDLFFIPQAAEMHGVAVADAKMLVLSFNNRTESLCDRCREAELAALIPQIDYDFRPLRITDTLYTFAKLMEEYITKNIKCSYLHELKQKELFVIMGAEFPTKDLVELFYPVAGGNIDFKNRVMDNYRYGLEVSELVERFGMSYSAFLRRFKKEFGEPAQEWMLKQKAKHIKMRLSVSTVTITDVIKEFDFSDSSHFTRFCRKYYGCTPTELIKSIRGADKQKV